MFNYVLSSGILGVICLLTFAILHWLNIPAGNLVDWLIGIASFWWLIAIVTVPWNIYFTAQEVLAEADISQQEGIQVKKQQLNYAHRVARLSLLVAIALHILSAVGLYTLAATGISAVGYISSGATLLLTALRPAIRAYQYLAVRLSLISEQIKYPREDVLKLREELLEVKTTLARLTRDIKPENLDSLMAQQQQQGQQNHQQIVTLQASLEQLEANNKLEHQHLSQEAKNAIAQLTEDSQFLDHVREIIRFFKTA